MMVSSSSVFVNRLLRSAVSRPKGGRSSAGSILDGTQPAQLQPNPFVVVVVNISPQSNSQVVEITKLVEMVELGFQSSEEAFHDRIVQAVTSPGHTEGNISLPQSFAIHRHSVLPALIRV